MPASKKESQGLTPAFLAPSHLSHHHLSLLLPFPLHGCMPPLLYPFLVSGPHTICPLSPAPPLLGLRCSLGHKACGHFNPQPATQQLLYWQQLHHCWVSYVGPEAEMGWNLSSCSAGVGGSGAEAAAVAQTLTLNLEPELKQQQPQLPACTQIQDVKWGEKPHQVNTAYVYVCVC